MNTSDNRPDYSLLPPIYIYVSPSAQADPERAIHCAVRRGITHLLAVAHGELSEDEYQRVKNPHVRDRYDAAYSYGCLVKELRFISPEEWAQQEHPCPACGEILRLYTRPAHGSTDPDSIGALALNTRALNCLWRAGIDTITELEHTTPSDLLALRGFGVASLDNVRRALTGVGKALKA